MLTVSLFVLRTITYRDIISVFMIGRIIPVTVKAVRQVVTVLIAAALTMISVFAFADGEFRPLPIDLSPGAPLRETYDSEKVIYEDPTIRVERSKRTLSEEISREYYIVDIEIKDASQIRTAPADPSTPFLSNRLVIASTIARRVNAVFAMNGDFCGDFHGHESSKYVLRQGTVYRDTVDTRLDTLLIDEDGDCHIVQGGDALVSMDKTQVNGKKVINLFQFGPALVIDGVPVDDEYIESADHSPQFADPDGREDRLCLVQVGPLHYKVIATRNGANMALFKKLVVSLVPECSNAYVLDGGGSLQLVFLGEWYNNVTQQTKQNVRKLSDIVYFASAWFEEGE